MLTVQPGDVLAVRTPGLAGELIRFGSALLDKDSLENHIAVFTHTDAKGTPWCLEGRPGGVGWADARPYLTNPYTLTDKGQPKTLEQRTAIVKDMTALLGTAYDWRAIFEDGANDLHIPDPWEETWHSGEVAGHVVCSSSAVIAYYRAKVGYPTAEDMAHIQPADWTDWIVQNKFF